MRRRGKNPFDEATLRRIADSPVEAAPRTPAYLDPRQSLAEVLAARDMIQLRAQIVVNDAIERLDDTWRGVRDRSPDALREHAVGFVAHRIGIYLRDLAGQAESALHSRAVQAAVEAAQAVGERRLAEMPRPLSRLSLREFFAPEDGTSQFEAVGDEMVVAAIDAYVQGLRREVIELAASSEDSV